MNSRGRGNICVWKLFCLLGSGTTMNDKLEVGHWCYVIHFLKIHFILAFCKHCFYQLFLEHVSGDLCGSLMRLTHLVICRKCTIKLFPYFDVVYNWLLLHFVHMCVSFKCTKKFGFLWNCSLDTKWDIFSKIRKKVEFSSAPEKYYDMAIVS